MAKIAFLFPGQGAQTVGMGREVAEQLPAARALFDEASAVLGYDLLQRCAEGPAEILNSTAVSQPALFVAGLAAVAKLKQMDPRSVGACTAAAGLSLGEYTALVFAGAMSFADGLRVVKVRGESMQAAADATPSGMVSVLGLDEEKLEQLCDKAVEAAQAAGDTGASMRIANYLCPGNLVVSGTKAACEEVERLAGEFGAMKTIRLAVAGAFHTAIMKPADQKLAAVLAEVTIAPPRIPVYSNVDAQPHTDPTAIRQLLERQVLQPVLWEKSLRQLQGDGFTKFYELGPGRVIAGLMKRIDRKADMTNIGV